MAEDYEESFTQSEAMKFLTETNDVRMEEELTRPRVEIWPYDEWQAWIALHDPKRRSILCHVESMIASPFCAMGYH